MSAAATLSPPDEGKVARAVRAAKAAAHRTVGAVNEVTVLYRSRRIVLLLPERAVVARTGPSDPTSLAADTRELAVSRRAGRRTRRGDGLGAYRRRRRGGDAMASRRT
jgi:hypothetical protein